MAVYPWDLAIEDGSIDVWLHSDLTVDGSLNVGGVSGIQNTPIGNITPSTAQFTDMAVDGTLTVAGLPITGSTADASLKDLMANGPAYWFDGVNDKIVHSVADFGDTDYKGSITALIKTDDVSSTAIFSTADEGTDLYRLLLGINTSGQLYVDQYNNDTACGVSGDTVITDNEYHTVGVTSDGTVWKLYVDGELESLTVNYGVNNGDWLADTDNRDNIAIGALIGSTPCVFFRGTIAEVKYWNNTLTAAEMATFANGASVPYKYSDANQDNKLIGNAVDFGADAVNKAAFDTAYTALGLKTYNAPDDIVVSSNVATITTSATNAGMQYNNVIPQGKSSETQINVTAITGTWNLCTFDAGFIVHDSFSTTGLKTIEVKIQVQGESLYLIANDASAHSISIDASAVSNVVTQIGCVLQDEPKGISNSKWYDSSSNHLDGAVTGAKVSNPEHEGWETFNLILDQNRANVLGKPSIKTHGIFSGFSMPIYAADSEEMWFGQRIPEEWDGVTGPMMLFLSAINSAEDIGDKYKYQLEWASAAPESVVPLGTTETLTHEITLTSGTAGFANELQFQLTPATLVAGGTVRMRLRRIDAAAPQLGAGQEVVIFDWGSKWKTDKPHTPESTYW